MLRLEVNGKSVEIDADPETPLLWALRDALRLTGTKYGCGMGLCGACTVHLEGEPVRSCSIPVTAAVGKAIVTIEGVGDSPLGSALQHAWRDLDVAQCGYCQSGQIMGAMALLSKNAQPTDDEITQAMNGHLCRCATYLRVRAAIRAVADSRA